MATQQALNATSVQQHQNAPVGVAVAGPNQFGLAPPALAVEPVLDLARQAVLASGRERLWHGRPRVEVRVEGIALVALMQHCHCPTFLMM